jgi:predicted component of type VI protein secretion system
MVSLTKVSFILAGFFTLALLGCSSISAQPQEVAPSYEPRSFDDVNPETVDLQLVSAPNLPEFPDCSGKPRNVRITLETAEYEAEIAPAITYPFLLMARCRDRRSSSVWATGSR